MVDRKEKLEKIISNLDKEGLLRLRTDLGVSQYKMALSLHIPFSTYWKNEKKKLGPKIKRKLVQYSNIILTDSFFDKYSI